MRALRFTAALAVSTALGFAAAAQAGNPPRVHVVRLEPKALVRGTGFRPQERLVVRLIGRGASTKRVLADDNGTFRVSLRTPPAQACGQYLLLVSRPVGKAVRVRIGPRECAPLGSDPGGSSP